MPTIAIPATFLFAVKGSLFGTSSSKKHIGKIFDY